MKIRRLLGVSSVSLASLVPAMGRAQDPTFGLGLFVGYNDRHAGLEWGAETFATFRVEPEDSQSARAGLGPMFQVGLIDGFSDPRLTFALHGGGELERNLFALTGELGLSYRFGAQHGFGVHSGLMTQVSLVNVAFRYQFLLREAWVGLGTRLMPTYGKPDYIAPEETARTSAGRPLRAVQGRVPPSAAWHAAHSGKVTVCPEERALGAAWERDAQLEYASIPAFIQLAHELTAQRAPGSLVRRALDAARDESAHALGCAALAGRYQRHAILPALPRYTPRPIAVDRAGLVRLAVESWLDGCLAEGCAARHAKRAAELAEPGAAQQLQRRIAADEQRHAELAWDTLAWTLSQAADEIRAALEPRRDHRAAPAADTDAPHGLERFGRVGASELDRICEQHAADSRERLDRLLTV